ncbi:MAG: hypothetical protein ACLFPB_04355 [Desulfovermiculus sp.]
MTDTKKVCPKPETARDVVAGVQVFPVCDRAVAVTALYIEARLHAEAIRTGGGMEF